MQNNNAATSVIRPRLVDDARRLADGWAVFAGGVALSRFPKCRIDLAIACREQVQAMLPDAHVEIRSL